MNMRKTGKRILSLGLAVLLALGTLPQTVFAVSGTPPMGAGGEIIAFTPLEDSIKNQTVPFGTALEDLEMPDSLTATVEVAAAEQTDNVQDSETPAQENTADTHEDTQDGDTTGEDSASGNHVPDSAADKQQNGTQSDVQQSDDGDLLQVQSVTDSAITLDESGVQGGDTTGEDSVSDHVPDSAITLGESGVQGDESKPEGQENGADADDGKALSTPSDAEGSDGADDDTASGSSADTDTTGTSPMTISVPVTWAADPDYDGDTAGIYTFTAEIAGFSLADEAQPPQITVAVCEVGGVITAFAEIPEDMRFQRGYTPDLPEALEATVGGEFITVPVTWESETDATQNGLHVFAATPAESYTLADGLKKPVLSFYRTSMVMARMAGSGNTDSPLEITTADQLAEIAALTNAGKLEEMVFGPGTEKQVHLKLMKDLDLAGKGDNDGWVPIGKESNQFKGSIEGGGHIITGLTINRDSNDDQGLFGYIGTGSTVNGLGLVNVNIDVPRSSVGGVAGIVAGTVKNCYSTGNIKGNIAAGGVAGIISGTVKNCYSTASVSGYLFAGGVVGGVYSDSEARVVNCAALNLNISGINVGRVVGNGVSTNFSGNIAFDGVAGSIVDPGHPRNGEGKIPADLQTAAGFPSAMTSGAWTYVPGKLPGLGGKTVDMPAHLLTEESFFTNGTGESGDPYQITTPAQLAKLAALVNSNADDLTNSGKYAQKHYELMNDLDLSGYASGEGWVPIGTTHGFDGYFNGNRQAITGLKINRTDSDKQGLFGRLGANSKVIDLGLLNISISGKDSVGGVAAEGIDGSTIENCFVTGRVTGNKNVGGIMGYAGSTVQDCFVTGNVIGHENVGGIVGYAGQKVERCFATGSVTGYENIGGVVGYVSATVADCVALNSSVSGSSAVGRVVGKHVAGGITGNYAFSGMIGGAGGGTSGFTGNSPGNIDGGSKTAVQLESQGGFPAVFNADPWTYTPGFLPGLFNAPVDMPAYINSSGSPFGGEGTSSNPYEIETEYQLARLVELVNNDAADTVNNDKYAAKHYKLMDNLDLSGYAGGEGWVPIGKGGKPFKGQFNGNKKTITGLTIKRSDNNQGLFGAIDIGGAVKDLGLVDVVINGQDSIGGVAGSVGGTIENCFVTGRVSGRNSVGGVASSVSGTVKNCFVTGSVSGQIYVGGVAGYVHSGGAAVENCFVAGSVSGQTYVGGVAGGSNGTISGSAALVPSVTATEDIDTSRRIANGSSGSGNYAFNGMTVNGTIVTNSSADNENGADMTAADAITSSFWTELMGWSTDIWKLQDDKLPILKGFADGVQNSDSGLYLTPKSADNLTVTVNPASYPYTGNPITPEIEVKFGNTLLTAEDYSLSYAPDNIHAGVVTVTVTGKGSYSGQKTADFTINAVAPGKPTGVTAIAGNGSATVSFEPPVNNGDSAITGYTVSASDGQTATGMASPITITGLINGTAYTFTVKATNAVDDSLPSDASHPVTPFVPAVEVTGVSVSPVSHSLTVGGTVQLNAAVTPGDATNQAVFWSSSAETVASVDSSGLVTARAAGTAFITVITAESGKTAQCTVTVTRAGSSDGGNSDDSSSKPTVTIPSTVPTAIQPDWPTVGSVSGKVAGTNTQRTFTVTDSLVKVSLEKAQAEAKKQGRTAYGVSARMALDMPAAAGLTLTLERAALNRLVSAGAKSFELTGTPISLTFNAQALSELQKQGTGNVTITVKPVTVDGIRNAYDITLTTVKDGKTVSIISLGTGSVTLSIPTVLDKNENVGGFYAITVGGNGKATRIPGSAYDANSGSVIFKTNHFSVYGVGYTAPSVKFTDIGSHWAKESIDYVVGRGLLGGTSDTAFSPDTAITRGDFVTALGRMVGVDTKAYTISSFTDVEAGSYYLPYIEWAHTKGIIQDIGSSQFVPERAITRQEIALILKNYAKATGFKLPVTREAVIFADASGIGGTYKTVVTAIQQAGIMAGEKNNKFNPTANATRAEVSAMLHRYIKLTIDSSTAQGWAINDAGQWMYYKDGKTITGAQIIDGVKYYFNDNGTLKTGWWDISSGDSKKTYYFNADGFLAQSTTIDGYEVDENGVRKDN